MNKQKDLMFAAWYDSLEGTKTHGFAYKAWSAGWEMAAYEEREECAELCEELSPPKDPEGTYIDYFQGKRWAAKQLAEAIRGRTT